VDRTNQWTVLPLTTQIDRSRMTKGERMAECVYCHAHTFLYHGGVPVCVKCADAHETKRRPPENVRTILLRAVTETTARAHAASEAFTAIMADVPSGLPHPDGTQRIHDAWRTLSEARKEVMKAHVRLEGFLSQGIIPEDLKQGSGK
jgi:hypothetical protein